MSVKRRNHEVPKGLLKNWLGNRGAEKGFHYFDLTNHDLRFEKGKGARFAITDYLYVPEREDGKRDDELENWFSVDENGLALFSRSAAAGNLQNFNNPKLLNQAIRGCIALGSRNAYSMYMVMKAMEPATHTLHELSVANVLDSIALKFRIFASWQFTVLYDLPVPLLINERPFMEITPRQLESVAMPLGPRTLLVGTPNDVPSETEMKISWVQATREHHKIAKIVNHFTLEMARQWIVAESKEELSNLQLELSPEKLKKRMQTDQVIVYQTKP